MGAVSPVPFADAGFMKKVVDQVVVPTVDGLKKEKIDYRGFIFVGLIMVNNDPYVIEYNCRMGDPETEVVMPRLANDLVELLVATGNEQLDQVTVSQDPRVACTVMAVSGGYPGDYEKGKAITGLELPVPVDSIVFHAGTSSKDGNTVTSGGRVLCVTSYGENIPEALGKSRKVLDQLNFEGMNYRRDIGFEFLKP
jgi:phosphoribosylamine--glycine ligase